jgi:pyruvate/2-oxoglutarate dehydrogenase complex dihydrolipoamide dehydrogenase (E3) component
VSKTDFDLAVIGAGSGGLTAAAAAAQFGQRVVLFEKGEMGGDCLNYGCVPSKALLAAAKQAHAMRSGEPFGIAAQEPIVDFKKVQAHVRRAIAAIAPNDSEERFEKLGVKVVRAAAHFRDRQTIEAGGKGFTARRMVIATGSRALVPPIPGLDDVPFLTNETLFDNAVLPRHLLIIGGGPIGMEMAQAHRRLGSEVTVFEAFDPLSKDDPELTTIVLERLMTEGIRILARTAIERVAKTMDGVSVKTKDKGAISGSHLLVAAGRQPNIEGLNLEAAGVAFTKKGVTVDMGLKTSNPRIYAVGDVAGGLQFTHVAGYHGGLVIRNALFGLPVKTNAVIPWVTYTDPELAHAGMTEAQARKEHGHAIKVLRWPFHDNDRAQTEGHSEGLVKVITGARGKILGASIVGPQAGELIQPWVLAMTRGLGVGAMVSPVLPYPTRGEASRRAAITFYADYASNPWVRRAIRVVNALRP